VLMTRGRPLLTDDFYNFIIPWKWKVRDVSFSLLVLFNGYYLVVNDKWRDLSGYEIHNLIF
jgi:hypothetical protein